MTSLFDGVDPLFGNGAQVGPVVAQVEDVDELLAATQHAEGELSFVEKFGVVTVFPVGFADASSVRELELVQM